MGKSNLKILVSISLLLSNISVYFSNSIVVPMLTTIATDLNVDISISGMVSTITMAVTGFALLGGNLIQRIIKAKWIVALALLLCALSNFGINLSSGFGTLLVCRAMVGVSLGSVSFATIALVTAWLSNEERGYYLALQTALITLCGFLASRVAVPLMRLMESGWRGLFVLMGMINLFVLAVWLCFGRKEPPQTMIQKPNTTSTNKNVFFRMLRRKEVLTLSAFLALISCSHVAVTTYLAAYLELVRSYELAKAASFMGYVSLAGMLGGPVATMFSTKMGRRKPILFLGAAAATIFMLLILNLEKELPLILGILAYGFFGAFYGPLAQIVTTEMWDSAPELASTAYSIVYAAGYLATIFTPLIMTAVMNVMTMQAAMYVFVAVYVLACVFVLLTEETGSKRRISSKGEIG